MAEGTQTSPEDLDARYEQARETYRTKDYDAAFLQFLPLAQAGYAKAQDYVGLMLRKGQGTEQDFSRAFLWLSRAADQGLASAITELGIMYDNGESVPKDFRRSHSLYFKAAQAGNARAMLKVGEDYLGGWGTYKDVPLALEWYTKARDAGRESAAGKIAEIEALIYEPKVEIPEGMGVEQFVEDLIGRMRNNDADACFTWALCARDGIGRDKQIQWFLEDLVTAVRLKSSAAIDMVKKVGSGAFARYAEAFYNAKMYRKAWRFADLAAALGNPDGDYVKGFIMLFGKDCEKDEAAAAEYLRKAAEKDDPQACYIYGRMYETGQGVKKDGVEEMRWLCRGAMLGSEDASKKVMEIIETMDYYPKPEEFDAFEPAALSGDGDACFYLALEYEYSLDEDIRDLCKAVRWFERGVAVGDEAAAESLDEIYASGEWDERDSLTLPALYGRAAENGHTFAALRLAEANPSAHA